MFSQNVLYNQSHTGTNKSKLTFYNNSSSQISFSFLLARITPGLHSSQLLIKSDAANQIEHQENYFSCYVDCIVWTAVHSGWDWQLLLITTFVLLHSRADHPACLPACLPIRIWWKCICCMVAWLACSAAHHWRIIYYSLEIKEKNCFHELVCIYLHILSNRTIIDLINFLSLI